MKIHVSVTMAERWTCSRDCLMKYSWFSHTDVSIVQVPIDLQSSKSDFVPMLRFHWLIHSKVFSLSEMTLQTKRKKRITSFHVFRFDEIRLLEATFVDNRINIAYKITAEIRHSLILLATSTAKHEGIDGVQCALSASDQTNESTWSTRDSLQQWLRWSIFFGQQILVLLSLSFRVSQPPSRRPYTQQISRVSERQQSWLPNNYPPPNNNDNNKNG